jgi:hypothetical protein
VDKMKDSEDRWVVYRLTRNMDQEFLTGLGPIQWHSNRDRSLLFFTAPSALKAASRLGAQIESTVDSAEWRVRRWIRSYEGNT